MRPLLPALLLLLPIPALALQSDTRVDEVTESSDGFACRAHALPELRLAHDWRDANRRATLDLTSRDSSAGDLRFRAGFEPDPDLPFGTAAQIRGFQLDLDRIPLRAEPRGAQLRIDGTPDATPLSVEGDRRSVTVAVIERWRHDLADRLMRANIVELDLNDASGVPLARYSWDVRALRRAPAQLQALNWSCR